MRDEIAKRIEYFELLKTKREKWESVWDELKKYVCPQTVSHKEIFDSSAIWARKQWASGMQSLLVNRAIKWFSIDLLEQNNLKSNGEQENLNENAEVRLWLEIVESSILNIFNNPASNFYNQIHEFFLTLGAYGTAIFYMEEDLELNTGVFFRNVNLRECYFEEDKYGFINSMYRLFKLNVKTAVSKWADFAPFKEKLLKSPDEEIEILHIVTLSDENSKTGSGKGGTNRKTSTTHEYTSTYIYLAEPQIISESGYSYFPFFVTRWIKEEGESYGYAPASHVLPDIKLLNSFRNTTAKVSQLQLSPPRLIPKFGYQLPLRNTPDAANYFDPNTPGKITNLSNIDNPVSTEVQQDKCRDAIFKSFDIDIFRMQKENKEMTATEVQARVEEQMRMMSPMIGRIETEFLNPLIRSIYRVLLKYNILPLLEGVGNIELDITYVSPLTKAQKSLAINGIEQVIGFFQHSGISNIYPAIYDNIDFDKCFKLLAELKGVPETILRSSKEVDQIRQKRMAAQQMQQLQAQQLPAQ